MPPKAEITKEKMEAAAFDLVRTQGLDELTARSIAHKLNCSTQPIYSVYGSMEQLKDDVLHRVTDFALDVMKRYENRNNKYAMNLLIGCLLFSQDERHLFRALYLSDYRSQFLARNKDRLQEEVYAAFLGIDSRLASLEESKRKQIFVKLMTYWLGIGTVVNTKPGAIGLQEATDMLEEMYKLLTHKEGLH